MNPILLERPLVVFDIESTGTDVSVDRIISLAALRFTPADILGPEYEERNQWIVNPQAFIPEKSSKVHGFTNESVKDKPVFQKVANQIWQFLNGADLCGYNLRNFDIPILWEEFYRCKIEWDLSSTKIVDASEIFRKKEPRTLSAALEKFCGRKHEDAHDAMADVLATWDVLNGQRKAYADIGGMNVHALAEFSSLDEFEGSPAKRLDLSGHIIETADGVARYTAKKVRGVALADDPGYGEWMLRNNFPTHTKLVLKRIFATL